MPHIERLEIRNWRSIRELDISPMPLSAIVGPNNAGKSNILAALDLVFGHSYPGEASLREEDACFGNRDLDPEICVRWRDGAGEVTDVIFRRDPDTGTFGLGHHKGEAMGAWRRGMRREEWRRFAVLRVGVDRRVAAHTPTNRWSLLGRLLQDVDAALRANPDRLGAFEDAIERLQDEILQSAPEFSMLRDALRASVKDQVGRGVEDVDIDLSMRDPWSFYRLLHLVFSETGMTFRADQAGAGLQSSFVLGIVRAYARLKHDDPVVIAIEEPELFLHPQAARRLYRVIRDIAYPANGDEGVQVLYTTHSAAMLELAHFDEVIRVEKRVGRRGISTTATQVPVDRVLDQLRAQGQPNVSEASLRATLGTWTDPRQAEGLFAAAVVLVEGVTEALTLPMFAQHLGVDLDALNVAVIAAHGKSMLAPLYRVFESFGIPCFVVADADGSATGSKRQTAERLNAELIEMTGTEGEAFPDADSVGPRLALWQTDFEDMLRREAASFEELEQEGALVVGSASRKPAVAAWVSKQLTERGEIPASIGALVTRVQELALEGTRRD